ncbi:MAG: response regulator transcription factor [Phycisphaerales bacterium]|nr:response regulator transcription factor [Phycisphaerales bacterium]
MKQIRVVLVDDHQVLRDAMTLVLQTDPVVKVVGTASNGNDGLDVLLRERPDVALLDIQMPGRSCFDVISTARNLLENTRFLLLSGFFNDQYIQMAMKLKIAGYVTKDEPAHKVLEAVHLAVQGKQIFSQAISERLTTVDKSKNLFAEVTVPLETLSMREKEVLIHLARGASIKEVAAMLNLSAKTVDNHTQRLMAKLDIHSRADLVRFAIREGLVPA